MIKLYFNDSGYYENTSAEIQTLFKFLKVRQKDFTNEQWERLEELILTFVEDSISTFIVENSKCGYSKFNGMTFVYTFLGIWNSVQFKYSNKYKNGKKPKMFLDFVEYIQVAEFLRYVELTEMNNSLTIDKIEIVAKLFCSSPFIYRDLDIENNSNEDYEIDDYTKDEYIF